jgi:hypothetical protein
MMKKACCNCKYGPYKAHEEPCRSCFACDWSKVGNNPLWQARDASPPEPRPFDAREVLEWLLEHRGVRWSGQIELDAAIADALNMNRGEVHEHRISKWAARRWWGSIQVDVEACQRALAELDGEEAEPSIHSYDWRADAVIHTGESISREQYLKNCGDGKHHVYDGCEIHSDIDNRPPAHYIACLVHGGLTLYAGGMTESDTNEYDTATTEPTIASQWDAQTVMTKAREQTLSDWVSTPLGGHPVASRRWTTDLW